ncbi:MAG: dTMP kinase, partial [Rickettsiales bacterium]
MTKGFFITFEGIEATGKSTQSKLLFDSFNKNKIEVIHTREPGGCTISERIRDILVNGHPDSIDKITELLLIFAARNEHILRKIKPAIENNITVICDRFIDSTIAYQGYGHNINVDFIKKLHNKLFNNFYPDLTIILDMDIEYTLNRISSRGGSEDRYEKMNISFHKRMQNGFHTLSSENQRYALVDANNSVEAIHDQIIS